MPLSAVDFVHCESVGLDESRYSATDVAERFPVTLRPMGQHMQAAIIAGGGEGAIATEHSWGLTMRAKPGDTPNQDGYAVAVLQPGTPQGEAVPEPIYVHVVVDGAGQSGNSHLAAEAAATTMLDSLYLFYQGGDFNDVADIVREGFDSAHRQVSYLRGLLRAECSIRQDLCSLDDKAKASYCHVGTTMTVSLVQGAQTLLFHVGDSTGAVAAVDAQGDVQASCITRPHARTVVQQDTIRAATGRAPTNEADWINLSAMNLITRAVGGGENGQPLQVTETPFVLSDAARKKSERLIVLGGSDGVLLDNYGCGDVLATWLADGADELQGQLLDDLVAAMQDDALRKETAGEMLTTLDGQTVRRTMTLKTVPGVVDRTIKPDHVTLFVHGVALSGPLPKRRRQGTRVDAQTDVDPPRER